MSKLLCGNIKLTFIRHGKTAGNEQKRYIGITDETLSDTGIKEVKQHINEGIYPEADVVFVSPMKRCIMTAGLIYPDSKVYVIDEFREIDFGTFEGKNYKELSENPDYQRWIDSNGTMPFHNGESREEFIKRCIKGFIKMLELIHNEKEIVAVVHGGTIMAVLSELLGGDYYSYQIDNGKTISCIVEDGKIVVSF
ncbi:MAG: histidine phosphatase family protein [Lachnospiraceae bacterium]|nr:histidine phosphatase family protein [Lachnospiraceae bacterium]